MTNGSQVIPACSRSLATPMPSRNWLFPKDIFETNVLPDWQNLLIACKAYRHCEVRIPGARQRTFLRKRRT